MLINFGMITGGEQLMTIGELCKQSGLSRKAVRLYVERGILPPSSVDSNTGYRFFDTDALDRALAIRALRAGDVPVLELKDQLERSGSPEDFVEGLKKHRAQLHESLERQASMLALLDMLISATPTASSECAGIVKKVVEPVLVVEARATAVLTDIGRHRRFSRLFGRVRWAAAGKPFALAYDMDTYQQPVGQRAVDYGVVFPVRSAINVPRAATRELPGGHCVSMIHKGLGGYNETYKKLFRYLREQGLTPKLPVREHFLKFFVLPTLHNADKVVTEIRVFY